MNKDGTCVKCGSDDLIRVPIVPGEGPHIAVENQRLLHAVPLTQVVCGSCGYIETWVQSPDDLARLREQYGRKT